MNGVSVEPARQETWTPRLAVTGTFKAVPGIDVSGQLAGMVSEVAVKNGQDVPQGALLFRIDNSTEQADLKSSEATLKNAMVAYQRQQSLTARDVGTRANLDAAIALRDTAGAAVERAKVLIAQKAITAPFAGRVGIRKVDVGQYVAAGAALTSLQQLDPIYIDFQAPEQFFGQLALGQTVTARLDMLGGLKVTGRIVNLDARVDRDTRTLLARAEVHNPDKKILPGMFGNVEVEAGNGARLGDAAAHGDRLFALWRFGLRRRPRRRAEGVRRTAPCRTALRSPGRFARRTRGRERRRQAG